MNIEIAILLTLPCLLYDVHGSFCVCAQPMRKALYCNVFPCWLGECPKWSLDMMIYGPKVFYLWYTFRADFRFAPNQWETVLLCNDVSRWLGTSLVSTLSFRRARKDRWCLDRWSAVIWVIRMTSLKPIYQRAPSEFILEWMLLYKSCTPYC